MPNSAPFEGLVEKIRALPTEKISEVADFVDFLKIRDEQERTALDAELDSSREDIRAGRERDGESVLLELEQRLG